MLTRWNPFNELNNVRQLMNQVFEDWDLNQGVVSDTAKPFMTPALDVVDKDDHVEVRADLPGIAPENVNIEFKDGYLTISGEVNCEEEVKEENYTRRERYYGAYRRSLRVPDNLDVDTANATFENGVLTLSLPKRAESKALRIPVKGVLEAGKK